VQRLQKFKTKTAFMRAPLDSILLFCSNCSDAETKRVPARHVWFLDYRSV